MSQSRQLKDTVLPTNSNQQAYNNRHGRSAGLNKFIIECSANLLCTIAQAQELSEHLMGYGTVSQYSRFINLISQCRRDACQLGKLVATKADARYFQSKAMLASAELQNEELSSLMVVQIPRILSSIEHQPS